MTTKQRKEPLPTKAKMLASMEREESRWREKAFLLQAKATEAFEQELYWHEMAVRLRAGPMQPELPLESHNATQNTSEWGVARPILAGGQPELPSLVQEVIAQRQEARRIAAEREATRERLAQRLAESLEPDNRDKGRDNTTGAAVSEPDSIACDKGQDKPPEPPASEMPIGDERDAARMRVAQSRAFRLANIVCAKPAGTCAHPHTYIEDGVTKCTTLRGIGE